MPDSIATFNHKSEDRVFLILEIIVLREIEFVPDVFHSCWRLEFAITHLVDKMAQKIHRRCQIWLKFNIEHKMYFEEKVEHTDDIVLRRYLFRTAKSIVILYIAKFIQ